MKIYSWICCVFAMILSTGTAWAQEPPNDEPMLQAELDALATAGGGDYYLPPGVFVVDAPLIIPSRVRLVGSGMGVTTIRGRYNGCKSIGACSVVATVGSEYVAISDLTVDKLTYSASGNGIEILPEGPFFSGDPSRYVTVERVEVLGDGPQHEYMIWNLRGEHIRILNNFVDGGTDDLVTQTYQEGIESYGGHDVVISHNTVRRIGNVCINTGSGSGLAGTDIRGVIVSENDLDACGAGVNAGSVGGALDVNTGTLISNNTMTNIGQFGVIIGASGAVDVRGLRIVGNHIETVGVPGRLGYGIYIVSVNPTHFSALISQNTISKATGFGVFTLNSKGIRIQGNHFSEIGYISILIYGGSDIHVDSNQINLSGAHSLYVWGAERVNARLNDMSEWGPISPSVIYMSTHRSVIRGNTFFHTSSATLPTVLYSPDSQGLVIQDNDSFN